MGSLICEKLDKIYQVLLLLKKNKTRVKVQFGICIPRSLKTKHNINGNSKWHDAVAKEVKLLYHDYECFKLIPKNEHVPAGYKCIPLILSFAVKYERRHRARCVASGHVTQIGMTTYT
jgi:hypothetical protein